MIHINLKYTRSILVNQQGYLKRKIEKKERKTKKPKKGGVFHCWFFWVGFFDANPVDTQSISIRFPNV